MQPPGYLEQLVKMLSRTEIPEFSTGASGYFSKPETDLDPAIFNDEHIRPEVRNQILGLLFRFWKRAGYRQPERWTTVWLAGSGASYQWAADRGNGDLDVLMGVDWDGFYAANPEWAHVSAEAMTEHLDDELRQDLWPRTARTEFGGKMYEVTYFVIQSASDIRTINPYAAYNLTACEWTVRPSRDTAYGHEFNGQWARYADDDLARAVDLRATILSALRNADGLQGPHRVTVLTRLSNAVGYAVAHLETIHGMRRQAFMNPLGHGYWDFDNWRWQMAKQGGIVAVLGAIARAHKEAVAAAQQAQYGGELGGPEELTVRAVREYRDYSG